jgi:hypothetical protein
VTTPPYPAAGRRGIGTVVEVTSFDGAELVGLPLGDEHPPSANAVAQSASAERVMRLRRRR